MIINAILFILQGIVNILLAPLTPLNWVINTALDISIISDFVNIVAFVLPWTNILPLITFIVAMFAFRTIVALIKTIWELIPVL